jgi:NADH pyrophosphatase NudC (nudix superfamily)
MASCPLTLQPSPVVAAIVTSERGVLIGKRNDGNPLWTFIAGRIEPGESAADAALREVSEETGLMVTAVKEIGRRVHPKSGRTMIYLACAPAGNNIDIFVGDEEELAEVKWANLSEAEELLPGMYEPVLNHIRRGLGHKEAG